MKSITLHNLDDKTVELIEKKSIETGLSLNKTIKLVLKGALGITEPDQKKEDFTEFLGLWDEKEFAEFNKATSDFEKVDPSDWK
ncbi:MAG: hypothetical protein AAF363_06605 [Bacteroidota bacterium]